MSDVKYISEEKYPVLIPVPGGVTVEFGDLMFFDSTDALRYDGSSIQTTCAYPMEYLRTTGSSLEVNIQTAKSYFVGVAIDDKIGQSNSPTINLTIATEGVFEFPLKPGRSVYPGDYFSACGTTSASDMYNRKIKRTTNIDKALGVFAERKPSAQRAYVSIRTILNPKKLN